MLNLLPQGNSTLNKIKNAGGQVLTALQALNEPQYSIFWSVELPTIPQPINQSKGKEEFADADGPNIQVVSANIPFPTITENMFVAGGRDLPIAGHIRMDGIIELELFNDGYDSALQYAMKWINLAGDKNGVYYYPMDYVHPVAIHLTDRMGLGNLDVQFLCWPVKVEFVNKLHYGPATNMNVKLSLKYIDYILEIPSGLLGKLGKVGETIQQGIKSATNIGSSVTKGLSALWGNKSGIPEGYFNTDLNGTSTITPIVTK